MRLNDKYSETRFIFEFVVLNLERNIKGGVGDELWSWCHSMIHRPPVALTIWGFNCIEIVSDIGHMTRTILKVVRPYSLS